MTVLWVENHPTFTRIAGRQFLAAHEVTVVTSLAAARSALAAETFDAVLLDYDLDDGKGAELVAFIQQLADAPIVVAASSHDHGNQSLLAAGADAACPKSRFAEVERVLASALERKGRA
jgi:DNA-binding NarL/FixJ family response regulator